MKRSKRFVQSANFPAFALACHAFAVNPCDELGVVHSVDRVNFLLACAAAVKRETERTRIQELQLLAETTAIRFYLYLCRFWDGSEVPPLQDLTSSEDLQAPTDAVYERSGSKYQRVDGVEFQVVE